MSVKAMDAVYSRWFLSSEYRTLMNENPELALMGYDLTDKEREKLSILSRKKRRAAKAKREKSIPAKKINLTVSNRIRFFHPRELSYNFSHN